MNPASSPINISTWFGCKMAVLIPALLVNSFWHFNPGKSQIRTVPSVEAVKSHWMEDWKATEVMFPVWPWRIFLAWILAVEAKSIDCIEIQKVIIIIISYSSQISDLPEKSGKFGDDVEFAKERVSSISKILAFGFPATAKNFLSGEIDKQFTC